MRAEGREDVSQAILRNPREDDPELIEERVTSLVIPGVTNGTSRADNKIEAMLQGLCDKATGNELISAEFEIGFLRRIKEVILLPR